MLFNRLGTSAIHVSDLCMGTMTFGSATHEEDARVIMDRAYDAGINFFDTAEVYPVPPKPEYVYTCEEIVGRWIKTKDRDSIVLATKVAGPGSAWFVPPVRNGNTALDSHNIRIAIEGSLTRLQTDYIDLYQTHWPDHDFGYEETLETLDALVREGKIRIIGSSNENAWGTMKANETSVRKGYARYQTIQNNFSINNRRFEDELADICRREKISLIPYSPLGGGVLTGKYNDGFPEGARFSTYKAEGERQQAMVNRFVNESSLATTRELKDIADDLKVGVNVLALAWSKQHDFVASTIFGVTTLEQLEQNLPAADLVLDQETLARIDAISKKYPYPMG